MGQLMLVNPKARGRKVKKTRSAAQKAATRKLVALNRAKRGTAKRKRNPVAALRSVAGKVRKYARRRRNPISTAAIRPTVSSIVNVGTQSFQGAGGALLVNTALNYIPLPDQLKSGNGKYLARAAMAVAVGVFGSKVLPRNVAANMAVGAMTVAMHDMMLNVVSRAMPTLRLGDVGDYDDGVSEFVSGVDRNDTFGQQGDIYDQGVGEYISGSR